MGATLVQRRHVSAFLWKRGFYSEVMALCTKTLICCTNCELHCTNSGFRWTKCRFALNSTFITEKETVQKTPTGNNGELNKTVPINPKGISGEFLSHITVQSFAVYVNGAHRKITTVQIIAEGKSGEKRSRSVPQAGVGKTVQKQAAGVSGENGPKPIGRQEWGK